MSTPSLPNQHMTLLHLFGLLGGAQLSIVPGFESQLAKRLAQQPTTLDLGQLGAIFASLGYEPSSPDYLALWSGVCRIVTDQGWGSGWFIHASQPLVVTCAHCVESTTSITIERILYGCLRVSTSAKIIALDLANDLAILSYDPSALWPHTPPTKLRLGARPRPGDPCTMCGFPQGCTTPRITKGFVSGFEQIELEEALIFGPVIDISANPGNSGGPIVNDQGLVSGILFAGHAAHILGAEQYDRVRFANDGIAFALDPELISAMIDAHLNVQGQITTEYNKFEPRKLSLSRASFIRLQQQAAAHCKQVPHTSTSGVFSVKDDALYLGWSTEAAKVRLDAAGLEALISLLYPHGGSFIFRGDEVLLYRRKYKGFIVRARITLTS